MFNVNARTTSDKSENRNARHTTSVCRAFLFALANDATPQSKLASEMSEPNATSNRLYCTAAAVSIKGLGAGCVASAPFPIQKEPSKKWSRVTSSPVFGAVDEPAAVLGVGDRERVGRKSSSALGSFPGNGLVVDPAIAAYVQVHQVLFVKNPSYKANSTNRKSLLQHSALSRLVTPL